MIALYDFLPEFCPNCGKPQKWDRYSKNDYYVKCSFTCECGLRFQFVKTRDLLEASYEGDLILT